MNAVRNHPPVQAFHDLFSAGKTGLPGGDGPLLGLRETRFARFADAGIPSQRAEAWKFTNVARHANVPMALGGHVQIGASELSAFFCGGHLARRMIFVNGHVSRDFSHVRGLPEGVSVRVLADAVDDGEVRERIAALDDGRSFTDLNAALMQSGAVIEVADGVHVAFPLQMLFAAVGSQRAATMNHPRLLVRLGRGAKLHLIETHAALQDGSTFTNLVSQIELGDEAELIHDRLQVGRDGSVLLSKADMRLGERSRLRQTLASLGGALVRNESTLHLDGTFADAVMNGAFMPTAREHVDNAICVHHRQPDCHSDQFYKGVMDGYGRGVFAGRIVVHEDAQRTNAFQTNNNLLLSDDAEIDSKPELEIYADDVKCSHGATCGDLDEQSLFYLRSRGIDADTARSILVYAFAGEVIERFADEGTRRLAMQHVFARLAGGGGLSGMLEG